MGVLVSRIERRPEMSTTFHFPDQILREKGICDNIVLEPEGDYPGWIAREADEAGKLCEELELA